LLDGEAGAEYVRGLARKDGWGFTPPERIVDIVEGLSLLDDNELDMIRGAVASAVKRKGYYGEVQKMRERRLIPKD
jgi:hypothetical protein